MRLKTLAVYATAVIFLLPTLNGCSNLGKSKTPRNIILLIGDGMGTTHVYAGMAVNGGSLNLERCEYVGLQKTYSYSSDVTDSGAAGTALATGVKTNNGSVGVDPDGRPVKSILEYAEENGLSTGLLATCAITQATPASFSAHNRKRGKYEDIAYDICRSGVDVIIGGGEYHFNKREDGVNLLDSLKDRGYYVSDEIENIPGEHVGPIAIFADTMDMPRAADGRGDLLARSTALAVKRLSGNSRGFFLMAEGSQIDWAAHANNTQSVVSEMIDFDLAVGEALDFAEQDGETLVIVTGDHETGGFSILKGGINNPEIEGAYGTHQHTGVMVPVFAYGPGAELFAGIYENTDIFEKMKSLFNF